MEPMFGRINRQSAFILGPLAVGALYMGWRHSLSVLLGGLIGIANLKGIAWSVRGLLGTEKAQAKMMALSMFKLLLIFSVLIILAILKVVKPYSLLVGFTVVFVLIIKEGLRVSRKEDSNDKG